MRTWKEVRGVATRPDIHVVVATGCHVLNLFIVQEEMLEGYKREGIDPSPYYWYTDQVRQCANSDQQHSGLSWLLSVTNGY